MKPGNGLRAAVYHRFHCLLPLVAHPFARRALRFVAWVCVAAYFALVAAILALRYVVLPQIETYRPTIERVVGEGLGLQVSIGRVEASWAGINPDLTLHDVRVADRDGRPALAFSRVEAIISWWSAPAANLRLRVLRIDEPTLHLRRDAAGAYFVAGIPLGDSGEEGGMSSWVLEQRRIRIRGATIVWEDDLRAAPALVLEDVNLALDNDGYRHRFGLTALPPGEMASRIDVRGDFRGGDFAELAEWTGQAYAAIDYADLAVWSRWVDYPVALPQGRGAVRAWMTLADGVVREMTTDLALEDVSLQLRRDLPVLALNRMAGRLSLRLPSGSAGFAASGKRVTLETRTSSPVGAAASLRIEPTDFQVGWQREGDGKTVLGNIGVSRADLSVLAGLAAYLPLDAASRQMLVDYAPAGRVTGLNARWRGDAERLQSYSLKAGVRDLGMTARGYFPGFSGITGSLEADEKGGRVELNSGVSSIDLPTVFPESLTRLDSLVVSAGWTIDDKGVEVELDKAEFSGPEAAGSAQGTYRTAADGPGVIDLTAALTRADARAVWRYMPHVVGAGARHWLRDSLLAGKATEAKLTLKGDLKDFPFLDKRLGQFLVTVKARDTVIDYAKGWPRIEGVQGDLRFEGNGMVVDAQKGRIFGAKLSRTHVVIPDFDAPVSTLRVKGEADGPTAEFLKFIDRSPVAERIDHFTEGMEARGNGHLDIDLAIPLDEKHLDDSQVRGTYRLIGNEVLVDTALPPLREVNGSIRFSGSDLNVPEITAQLFGGPLKIQGGLQKDGRVLIAINGSADIAQLRKQGASPWLDKLSGATAYRGEIRINKRNADLMVESDLVGLASTLPEPFSKAAGETWPLRFEKRLLAQAVSGDATVRDQISASLGPNMSLQLIRRKTPEGFVAERGGVAVGRPLQLPEKGVSVGLSAKRLDVDTWLALFESGGEGQGNTNTAKAFEPDALSLQAGELVMRGMIWNDVDLTVTRSPRQWRIGLNSRQAAGDIVWDGDGGEGNGRLVARLSRLALEQSTTEAATKPADPARKLPALDIVADDFSVRQLRFGRLELRASNDGGVWNLRRISTSNPHGTFTGQGTWQRSGGAGRTQLDFRMDSSDVGELLGRLGYPGTMRAGTARLDGKLTWNGGPTDIDFASLNGDLGLEASKGQFLKLDPGAAGKLLGLISLQNLPRRVTLDFKDVFSAGFAFDSIAGKMTVQKGVMRTDHLEIAGPAARVVMRGEVDLKRETQRLNVNVLPEVGDTAALGVAIVNPAAGAATWLASKLLKNPLGNVFGYTYRITGTWDDPKVEKLSSAATTNEGAPGQPAMHQPPGGPVP